ncbi:hypothetical protein ACAW74_24010 [Fibrella sp. WM1]|uniref:hypothetical protein n=1 Tax=Fibrella musci TaxID=3242485 RepID=UPI0035207B7E
MKYSFAFLLFLCELSSFGQQLSGLVLNKSDNKPIPFATILLKNGNNILTGTSSNERGDFLIDYDLGKVDSVAVSAIGFYGLTIACPKSSFTIYLKERPIPLQEMVVLSSTNKEKIFGPTQENATVVFTPNSYLTELATYIYNDEGTSGYVKDVSVFVGVLGNKRTPFRLRFYKNNDGKPGEELTTTSIVAKGKRKGKWLKVSLEEYNIIFPAEGFFASVDWFTPADERFAYKIASTKLKPEDPSLVDRYGNSIGLVVAKVSAMFIRVDNSSWRKYTTNLDKDIVMMLNITVRL